jgi:MYXO-CTERM domain-containing protein
MKRTVVSVFGFSLFAFATTARADELQSKPHVQPAAGYEAVRSVLFVPTDTISLVPTTMCPVSQSGGNNSGLGCSAAITDPLDHMPAANVDDVITGITTALAPFNVLVTSTRPPEYVPYTMLLVGDEVDDMGLSRTCAPAPINCDAVKRNEIGFTTGGSMFCMDPDPVQAALIAFGYMSGLENNDNPMDPMFYQDAAPFGPDFTMPALEYQDMCSNLVMTVDDMEMANPIACPQSVNHAPYCMDMDNMANSVAELTAYYGAGPFPEDTMPPTVDTSALPAEGDMVDGDLDLTVTATDDMGLVFVRLTIQSTALIGLDPSVDETGSVCKAHNDVCPFAFEFPMAVPYQQNPDNTYSANEFAQAPGGDYTVTVEASDLAGNVIEPIVVHFTKGGGMADSSGGMTTATDATASATDATATASDGESSSSTGIEGPEDGGQTDDGGGGGCGCSTESGAGGLASLFLGIVGFAATRRRRK